MSPPTGLPGEYSVNVSAPGSQPLALTLDNLDTPVAGLQASHSGTAPVGQAVIFTATVQGGTSIVYVWEFQAMARRSAHLKTR